MQAIDELRRVRHGHFVRMPLEGVQREAGKKRIPEREHLRKTVPRADLRPRAVPGTPFVDNQLDVVVWVRFRHDRPVIAKDRVHRVALGE